MSWNARTWCRCAVRGAARLERVIPYLEVKSRQQGSERLRRSLTLHATDCETESETEKGIENELENDPGNESWKRDWKLFKYNEI